MFKFFSEEVQKKMVEFKEMKEYVENQIPPEHRKKAVKTSYFVKCIRKWYEACDSRGLSPHTRIERLHAFDKLLTKIHVHLCVLSQSMLRWFYTCYPYNLNK